MSDKPPPPGKTARTSALLGDLESIRSLLAENRAAGAPEEDDEVPLLEDVVQGGVSVNEAFLAGEGDFEESGSASGLDDDVFQALLSNEWRESRGAAHHGPDASHGRDAGHSTRAGHSTSAGDGSDARPSDRLPELPDELDAVIMAHVDAALQRWLRETVLSGIDDLRRELLAAVRQQLGDTIVADTNVADRIAAEVNKTSADEDSDGA